MEVVLANVLFVEDQELVMLTIVKSVQSKKRIEVRYLHICFQSHSILDGCPKIVNLGSSKTDLFYERKKYGFKKR
jgi:hypothetical protein